MRGKLIHFVFIDAFDKEKVDQDRHAKGTISKVVKQIEEINKYLLGDSGKEIR